MGVEFDSRGEAEIGSTPRGGYGVIDSETCASPLP